MKAWRASLITVLVAQLALPACIATDSRGRRRAEYDQKALAEGQKAKTVATRTGAFLVESTIYHPALLPLEGFFKQLAQGNFAKAADQLDLRYVPTNVDASLIAELLDAGYLPALVKVTNTGLAPVSMQSLLLSASLGQERGLAVPNEELPTKLDEVHWSNLGANAAGIAGNTAIVVGIIALAYVGAQSMGKSPNAANVLRLVPHAQLGPVQIGFEDGVLCPNGVPVSFDGKPFTNDQAAALASACFKRANAIPVPTLKMNRQLTRVVDLDYSQVLLRYMTLAPGESSVGLQFFKMPGGIADWQAAAVHAEVLPNGPVSEALSLANVGATTKDVGFFLGDAGAKVQLKPMIQFRCGIDDDSGRFTMTFLDTYGEEVLNQKLEIVFGGKDLPKTGIYAFDPSDSDQKVTLYLGTDLGALNGAWRSFVAGSKRSECRMNLAQAERTVRTGRRLEGSSLAFFDEFFVAGSLDCNRVADFDTGSTKQWIRFKADVACRGPWQGVRDQTARAKAERPVRARDL